MKLFNILKDLGIKVDEDLILKALTHSSYANEHHLESNERLEYLGDAVLELCMSTHLYTTYSNVSEGVLTKKRAQAVREEALDIYASKLNLSEYLRLGNGELKMGGKENKAIIADAFEALLGAIYISNGFHLAYKAFLNFVVPYLDEVLNIKDYKSIFQEEIQSEKRNIRYEIVGETGPTHDKVFEAVVYIDDLIFGRGFGKTKKEAEQNAAKEALEKRAE